MTIVTTTLMACHCEKSALQPAKIRSSVATMEHGKKLRFRNFNAIVYIRLSFSIPLTERCDGFTQCKDKSDELQCKKILVDPSYIKNLSPPPTENGNPTTSLMLRFRNTHFTRLGKPDLTISQRIQILHVDDANSKVRVQVNNSCNALGRRGLRVQKHFSLECGYHGGTRD